MSESLVFVDESGDAGRRPGSGSSMALVLALIHFPDRLEGERCDARIDQLREELQKPPRFEFHFRRDSYQTRITFLQAVSPYEFTYHAAVLHKQVGAVPAADVLFSSALARLLGLASQELREATIVIDGSGDRRYRRQVITSLRTQLREKVVERSIVKVKLQRSESNNLLQLADYAAGIVHRSVQQKPGADEYRRLLASHERGVHEWRI